MPDYVKLDERAEQFAQMWAMGYVVNLLKRADNGLGQQQLCYSHGLITNALRKLAYRQSAGSCVVRYSYGDGKPEMKLCVPHLGPNSFPGQRRTCQFYVGLLAGRHTAMEPGIDFHLLLNDEVNPNQPGWTDYRAENEAYDRATAMFNELPPDSAIRLVQTGWVPVVMGFYRAFFGFVSSPAGRHDVTVLPVITIPRPRVFVGRNLWDQAKRLTTWAPGLFELSNSELTLLREGRLSAGELACLKKEYPALSSSLTNIQEMAIREAPAF